MGLLSELAELFWLSDPKSCSSCPSCPSCPCEWIDCSGGSLAVWWPSFACGSGFLAVHTHKPQPLSHTTQGGFSEKWYSSSPAKQAAVLEAFLESQAVLSTPAYLPSAFPFPATRRGELMIHLLPVTFWITGLWSISETLGPPPSPFHFPSLALIFTASLLVYMPERLREAKHLLPLPPCIRELFHPASFLPLTSLGRLASWLARALPESVHFTKTKTWILTRTHLLTTPGLPSPKWRFGEGHPNKVDRRIFCFPRVKLDVFIFLPFFSSFLCQPVFGWSSCLYTSF